MTTTGTALRFLVVEDDENVRAALARMVRQLGHSTDEAGDGVQAVEALVFGRYDVVLLDLALPRLGGQEVLRWLRKHLHYAAGLRVIVLSAAVGAHAHAMDVPGADAVLPKPLRREQLQDLINDLDTVATHPRDLARPSEQASPD